MAKITRCETVVKGSAVSLYSTTTFYGYKITLNTFKMHIVDVEKRQIFFQYCCSYYFLFSFKDQRKLVEQSNSKNHQCVECGKGFSTERNLRLHSQYHTGKFSYYCGQCRKGFHNKSHYGKTCVNMKVEVILVNTVPSYLTIPKV